MTDCMIASTALGFSREPLKAPFGFKGGALSELWQVICRVQDTQGRSGFGLGVQSVLWSDAEVFRNASQAGGNAWMLATTQYALQTLRQRVFTTPPAMLHDLFDDVYAYAQRVTNRQDLRKTFVLNALVPVDLALWQLYAARLQTASLAELAAPFTHALTQEQAKIGRIPLISYGTTEQEVRALAREGCFLYKMKLGADPGGAGDLDAMLDWDMHRLSQVHEWVGGDMTPYTDCGKPLYYLDMNGRYDSVQRVQALLAHADRIGALERIALLEEPFPEDAQLPVHALPVRVAADESAHTASDVVRLIDHLGYSALALKPIAKTLSATLEMLEAAHQRNIPCFCADLTVNPLMCAWNKSVACRLQTLPGIKIGVLESNGKQNYAHWSHMCSLYPQHVETVHAVEMLTPAFFATNGGIWETPTGYTALLDDPGTQ